MRLPALPTVVTPAMQQAHSRKARVVGLFAAVVYGASAYLPWAYGAEALDNMSYLFGPSPLQFLGLSLAVVHVIALTGSLFAASIARVRGRTKLLHRFDWNRAAQARRRCCTGHRRSAASSTSSTARGSPWPRGSSPSPAAGSCP